MIRIDNIKIPVENGPDIHNIKSVAAKKMKIKESDIKNFRIARKSVDARDKDNVCYAISVEFSCSNEKKLLKIKNVSEAVKYEYIIKKVNTDKKVIIVGFGPTGMFASLVLARAGISPIIIERGRSVEKREADIERFRKSGILDVSSNVQFGEGGAGTFSDGKLTTGIKDKSCRFILEEFVRYGAPEEILYSSKPHIGTDKLIGTVKRIREEIISLGGDVRFENCLTDIKEEKGKIKSVVIKNSKEIYEEEADYLILAVGHSARDTFEILSEKPIKIEQKPFAVGVRIEHKQEMINRAQYGKAAEYLAAADYKLWTHLDNGRGVYTFCMCPGGVVSAAASEEGMVVTNGMSYYARNGENSNAALLVGVDTRDFGTEDVFGGVEFQRKLERTAFEVGGRNYFAPVQTVGDILNDKESKELGDVVPTYRPGVTPCDMREIFPEEIYRSIKRGIVEFDKKLKGFADKNAVLTAVESRSSSPIRIVRDERLYSAIEGVMPCGEGCGYAGGIMSAAADGIKCAERIIGECGDTTNA